VDQVEDAGPQLLLYSDLVQQLVPGKRLRLRFGVITKAKEPAVELHEVAADPQQIIRTKRVVARVWRAIAAGHFYPSPSPLACGSCPYREPCREWTG
jgi:CRISPR/Cas system-associated exonuclease Cas4 (RecB family)